MDGNAAAAANASDGGYLYNYGTSNGKEKYLRIMGGDDAPLKHLVPNDPEYTKHQEPQVILNVSHIVSCIAQIGNSDGPPCTFPIPSVAYCQDLRSAMGESYWLYGIVGLTDAAYDDLYDAVKDETVSGVADTFPRLHIDLCKGTILEDTLSDDENELLMRRVEEGGTLSDLQIKTLRVLIRQSALKEPQVKEPEDMDEETEC